jgi:hypothetical protein
MHRPLREVLRAGFVQPTDAVMFATKHLPFLEPQTAEFNIFKGKDGRTIQEETFEHVRGKTASGAHFMLSRVGKHIEFGRKIRSRTPKDFEPDEMDWFHGWIETQKNMLLAQLNAWPGQIETYNRLSLCKLDGITRAGAFSLYKIVEPMELLTRGDMGEWDWWLDHDDRMRVWFKVWQILMSSASGTHALVFDKA